jgi:TM2 domain-containing membrane protein YozV
MHHNFFLNVINDLLIIIFILLLLLNYIKYLVLYLFLFKKNYYKLFINFIKYHHHQY